MPTKRRTPQSAYCAAFQEIVATSSELDRPLTVAELVRIMSRHDDVDAALRQIEIEMGKGVEFDSEMVAVRLRIPHYFCHDFLKALRRADEARGRRVVSVDRPPPVISFSKTTVAAGSRAAARTPTRARGAAQ